MTTKRAKRRKGGAGRPLSNKTGNSRADRKAATAKRMALDVVKAAAAAKTAAPAKAKTAKPKAAKKVATPAAAKTAKKG